MQAYAFLIASKCSFDSKHRYIYHIQKIEFIYYLRQIRSIETLQ